MLYIKVVVTAISSLLILYPVTDYVIGFNSEYTVGEKVFNGMNLYFCGIIGLVITGLLIWVTEYYTGTNYRPVSVAYLHNRSWNQCNSRIGSFNGSDSHTALIIVTGILATNTIAGLYGIAIAVTTMLALAGMVVALDAYGPVTDNAGGIAEMSKLPNNVRKTTDALDAVEIQ